MTLVLKKYLRVWKRSPEVCVKLRRKRKKPSMLPIPVIFFRSACMKNCKEYIQTNFRLGYTFEIINILKIHMQIRAIG